MWKRRSLDATTKGPWSRAVQARSLVVWSASMPREGVPTLLDGQAEIHAACSRHHSIDIIIMLGMASIVDVTASVTVWPETFVHRWSVWSGR